MNTNYRITVGILNHNEDIFNKYIKSCLKKIKNQCDIIIIKNLNPAKAYNKIIEQSKNEIIVLLHCDTSFSSDFIEIIKKSIKYYPDFGALGIMGVKKSIFRKKKYIHANSTKIIDVTTLEPSCIVINKKHNLKFDDTNFDEYHHIVEDYCAQVRFTLNLKIYTLLINAHISNDKNFHKIVLESKYFVHYNSTFSKRGSRWGNWLKYKNRLNKKWKQKVITT